jgi:hypothetical protein
MMSETEVGESGPVGKNGYEMALFKGCKQLLVTDGKWNSENEGHFKRQEGYPLASSGSESKLDEDSSK